MIQKVFTVHNHMGIHARPATKLVQVAITFPCEIILEKDGKRMNGKSIMGVMSMAAMFQDRLTVTANGEGEAEAIEAIGEIIEASHEEA
ncbi:HPr family phosphocarrier protein [Brevibacillus migulae]|uniref:HPr family phosphocarrier protein n=1 Tax=Brevibacillus migulae TaxID=1644114 RepID=UPI00106E6C37|nr:HPr family phosphocarrier protein [Brevibacillus migulae]